MLLFFSIEFRDISDVLEAIVLLLVFAGIMFAGAVGVAFLIRRTGIKLEESTKNSNDCPWYLRWYSWGKRHTPLLGVVASLLALLFVYRYLPQITYWVNNARPVLPGQQQLDGDQIIAEQQAGGIKQLGAIFSTLLGGTFYFSTLLFGTWSLMSFIFPEVPRWAKKNFSKGFLEYDDDPDKYDPLKALPLVEKFRTKLRILFGLLALWAGCLYIAAQVQ